MQAPSSSAQPLAGEVVKPIRPLDHYDTPVDEYVRAHTRELANAVGTRRVEHRRVTEVDLWAKMSREEQARYDHEFRAEAIKLSGSARRYANWGGQAAIDRLVALNPHIVERGVVPPLGWAELTVYDMKPRMQDLRAKALDLWEKMSKADRAPYELEWVRRKTRHSGFDEYLHQICPNLATDLPATTADEVKQKAMGQWQTMSKADKAPYAKAHARYRRGVMAYNANATEKRRDRRQMWKDIGNEPLGKDAAANWLREAIEKDTGMTWLQQSLHEQDAPHEGCECEICLPDPARPYFLKNAPRIPRDSLLRP